VASKKVGEIIFSFSFLAGKKQRRMTMSKKIVGNIKCRKVFVLAFQKILVLLLPYSKNATKISEDLKYYET
jgi:hypothetical protein